MLAPATEAIAYEARRWDPTNTFFGNGSVNPDRQNKGFGPPSQEVEDTWTDMIQCKRRAAPRWRARLTSTDQNIRLREEELGEYRGRPGLVEFADGSGYYATLSAYHSLHCE